MQIATTAGYSYGIDCSPPYSPQLTSIHAWSTVLRCKMLLNAVSLALSVLLRNLNYQLQML